MNRALAQGFAIAILILAPITASAGFMQPSGFTVYAEPWDLDTQDCRNAQGPTYQGTFTPPGSTPNDAYYDVKTNGAGTAQVRPHTQSTGICDGGFFVTDNSAPYFSSLDFSEGGISNFDMCTGASSQNPNYRFDVVFPTLATGAIIETRMGPAGTPSTASGPVNTFGVRVTGIVGNDPIVAFARDSTGEQTQSFGTVTPGAYYRVNIFEGGAQGCGTGSAPSIAICQYANKASANGNCLNGNGGQLASFTMVTGFTVPIIALQTGFAGTVTTSADAILDEIVVSNSGARGPDIFSIDPTSGPLQGGQSVTITGAGFERVNAAWLGGSPINNLQVSNGGQTITGTTTAHAAGLVDVQVATTFNEQDFLLNGYQYVASGTTGLDIISVVPNQGTIGTHINVKLNRRDVQNPTFFVGLKEAQQTGLPANSGTIDRIYHVIAPTNAVGTYDVSVASNNYATVTEPQSYTYLPPTFEGACPNYRPYNFEGFEPPAQPSDVPARCWYDFFPTGTTTHEITNETYQSVRQFTAGTTVSPRPTPPDEQSLEIESTGASQTRFNLKNGWNACDTRWASNNYEFAIRLENSGLRRIGVSDKTTNPFDDTTAHASWITLQVGVAATLNLRNAASTNTQTTTFTPSAGIWYHFFFNERCRDSFEIGGNKYEVGVGIYGPDGAFITQPTNAAIVVGAPVVADMRQFVMTTTAAHHTYLDDLKFGIAVAVDRDTNAPVGRNFVGFDASADAGALVARTNEPNNVIRTYDVDIEAYNTDTTDNCNQAHGVLSWTSEVVAWISCGDPDHKHLTIRTPIALSEATQRSYEIDHLGDEGASGADEEIRDDTLEIFKMYRWPVDYNAHSTNLGDDQTFLAFAFSESSTGQVGVFLENQRDNADDQARGTRAEFAPNGQTVEQICIVSWDIDGNAPIGANGDNGKRDFLVAVHPTVGLGIWKITLPNGDTGFGDPILTGGKINNPEFDGAQSVDCAVDRALITTESGNVRLVQVVPIQKGPKTGDVLYSAQLGNGSPRGVALSQNGRYGVVAFTIGVGVDQDSVMIGAVYDLDGEATVATIAMKYTPGSSLQNTQPFFTMRLDRYTNYLYAMYSDDLRRYPLLELLNNGTYVIDPDPLNPGGDPKGDMDVGCYTGPMEDDGDGIENEDDPNVDDCDADNDGTPDGEDTSVCPDAGGPCYDGTKLAERCDGVNNDACETYKEAVRENDSGIRPEGSGEAFGFNLSGTACILIGLLMIALGAGAGAWLAWKSRAGGAALPGGGAVLGLVVGVWQFCIPPWVVFILAGIVILGVLWMFVRGTRGG